MAEKTLRLAPDLELPLDAATRRMAILAMSGAGKSNTAVVLAEAMFDAGIPWVAIDPKGDWWGIRSSTDGKGSGLPIPIFGGLHGDLQIEGTAIAGRQLAEAIVEYRLTCVVDVSEFVDRQSMWGFLAAFGETLLHRNRKVLHLFLEEADEYIPQSTKEKGNLPKCLGVWQRVVKRGRFRGLGSTQISQRSAALNKDTLYMAEALIAMRATGKGDRDAIKGWVEYNNAAAEIVASLQSLADGEGWFSSPAWLQETRRLKFFRRRTFDSGATPVLVAAAGGSSRPATLADVDLSALQQKMSAAIEKAKADDPVELRKEISALKAQLRQQKAPAVIDPEIATTIRREGERAAERRLQPQISKLEKAIESALRSLHSVNGFKVQVAEALQPKPPEPSKMPTPQQPQPPRVHKAVVGEGKIPSGERKILTVLAQHPEGRTDTQVAILTNYAVGTGGFNNYLGSLRSKGWIDGRGGAPLRITPEGIAALGDYEPLPTGGALLEHWLHKLGKAERAVLQELASVHPGSLTDEELAERTDYTAGTGGFNNAIGRLRTLQLINGSKRDLRASDDLF